MRGKERVMSALLAGALTLGGCRPVDIGKTPLSPTKIEQTNPIEFTWGSLPATERVDRLELKNFPKNLDVDTEIVRAISELYAQQMPIKTSKETMQASVHFVDTSTFLEKYQESLRRPFINNEERKLAETSPEIVFWPADLDQTKRQIFINKSRISPIAVGTKQNMSAQDAKKLGGYDLEIVLEMSILSHAVSHLNQSAEKLDFPPVAIVINQETFLITGIHGLDLQMTNLDKGSSVILTGTDEAMTDRIASFIGTKSGLFIFSRSYFPATMLVGELNKRAGIDNNEFKDYYFGNKSIKDLLTKWGSIRDPRRPNISSGINLYFLIASAVNPGNNPKIIRQLIEQEIGQKLSN